MSKRTSKEKKEYEARLQQNLKNLKLQFDAGKIMFVEGSPAIESLLKVKLAPDGRVDLKTVDGSVRAMAMAISALTEREELKKQPRLQTYRQIISIFSKTILGIFTKIWSSGACRLMMWAPPYHGIQKR